MDGVIAFWKVFAECKQKERGYEIRKKARPVCKSGCGGGQEARKTVKSLRAREIREIKFYNWPGEIFHKIVNWTNEFSHRKFYKKKSLNNSFPLEYLLNQNLFYSSIVKIEDCPILPVRLTIIWPSYPNLQVQVKHFTWSNFSSS